jgi:phenylacetate-CoA ligase
MHVEDSLYHFLHVYRRSPQFVKNGIAFILNTFIPDPVRYGRNYAYFKKLVGESKNWGEKEIKSYQLQQLNQLLEVAKQNIPYYRKSLRSVKLPVKTLEEFNEKVPLLTRDGLRNDTESFYNPKIPRKKTLRKSTGGTTGELLKIFVEKGKSRTKELVFMNDQWNRIGFQPNDLRVVFRSAVIPGRNRNKRWYFDPIKNRYFFSSIDLSEENLEKYVKKIRKIKPKFFHVYPSVLSILAAYMKKNKIKPFEGLKGIFSGSENTYPAQIKLFEEVFDTRVFRWYGLGEASALAGSCEFTHDYHCHPAYSYTELLDSEGKTVREIGQKGEIVGTTFDNVAMPLIRYRTNDHAVYGGERCSKCRRQGLILKEIEGRSHEVIFDRNKHQYSIGPFIFGFPYEFWHNLKTIQFEQFKPGELILRVLNHDIPEIKMNQYIDEYLVNRFCENFVLKIVLVDEMERTKSGKHKYLIQHIKP